MGQPSCKYLQRLSNTFWQLLWRVIKEFLCETCWMTSCKFFTRRLSTIIISYSLFLFYLCLWTWTVFRVFFCLSRTSAFLEFAAKKIFFISSFLELVRCRVCHYSDTVAKSWQDLSANLTLFYSSPFFVAKIPLLVWLFVVLSQNPISGNKSVW